MNCPDSWCVVYREKKSFAQPFRPGLPCDGIPSTGIRDTVLLLAGRESRNTVTRRGDFHWEYPVLRKSNSRSCVRIVCVSRYSGIPGDESLFVG